MFWYELHHPEPPVSHKNTVIFSSVTRTAEISIGYNTKASVITHD